MPNYDFECKKCKKRYEFLTAHDPSGKYKNVKCPFCKSKSKTFIIGMPGYAFANPEGTDRYTSDSTGHDYRYKHAKPKVAAEREYAEKHSHVGPNPYGEIDDISCGKYFGEVK